VTYLLKARTVEPEKQPLLANGSETTFVSRQRFSKHVPVPTDTHATIEVLLEMVFSTRSVKSGYMEDDWGNLVSSVRESVKERVCWKGAAVQRGLQRGSRGIALVRSRYHKTSSEYTVTWKKYSVCCRVLECYTYFYVMHPVVYRQWYVSGHSTQQHFETQ
jgi:hypothetical protein